MCAHISKFLALCRVWTHQGATVTPLHCSEHRRGLKGEYQACLQVSDCKKGGEARWNETKCVVQPSLPPFTLTRQQETSGWGTVG